MLYNNSLANLVCFFLIFFLLMPHYDMWYMYLYNHTCYGFSFRGQFAPLNMKMKSETKSLIIEIINYETNIKIYMTVI